jgi:hypothetical protein
MVVPQGTAPCISGCKPDVLLSYAGTIKLVVLLGFAPRQDANQATMLLLHQRTFYNGFYFSFHIHKFSFH